MRLSVVGFIFAVVLMSAGGYIDVHAVTNSVGLWTGQILKTVGFFLAIAILIGKKRF